MPRNTSSMLAILKVDMFRGEGALQEMHTIHRDCMSSSRLQVITVRIGFGGMYIILWLGRNPFELCCQFSDLPPPTHILLYFSTLNSPAAVPGALKAGLHFPCGP